MRTKKPATAIRTLGRDVGRIRLLHDALGLSRRSQRNLSDDFWTMRKMTG